MTARTIAASRRRLLAALLAGVATPQALARAVDFEVVPLGIEAEQLSLVPTHPEVLARGRLAVLAQSEDGERCEVGWLEVPDAGAGDGASAAVTSPSWRACAEDEGFYNLLPGATAEAPPELVAVTPDGIHFLSRDPAELLPVGTLLAVAPEHRFAGPPLWDDPRTPPGALRLVVPGLDGVTVWERAAEAPHGFRQIERFAARVRASYNARSGRDALHPDYHLLANLRMPKFALGAIEPGGDASSMVVGLENEIRILRDDGSGVAPVEHDLDLFRDDDLGLNVVRGNRLGDFDGDGGLDAVIVAARGGLTNLTGRLAVYLSPLERTLTAEPALRFEVSDAAAGTELFDVDRDGVVELYRPTIQFSVGALVRILLFKELEVEYRFAELVPDEDGELDWFCTLEQSFTVNLGGVAKHPGPMFDLRGDFDGDGVLDVVAGTPEDGYALRPGRLRDGVWCPAPATEAIELESIESLSIVELGGDGRADLLAWTASEDGKRRLFLLRPR